MMDDFRNAYGLRSIRLRYFNAAGADPDGELGESHDPETHLIPLVLDVAAGLRDSISIFGDDYPTPDGTAIRDYIHVSDLARAHVSALQYVLSGGEAEVSFNLGSGRGTSVAELVAVGEHVTQKSIKTHLAGRRRGDPAQLVAAADRAQKFLGWTARRSNIDVIVRDAWSWHRRRSSVTVPRHSHALPTSA
jgi:UDP-glucose 4-epimerase